MNNGNINIGQQLRNIKIILLIIIIAIKNNEDNKERKCKSNYKYNFVYFKGSNIFRD